MTLHLFLLWLLMLRSPQPALKLVIAPAGASAITVTLENDGPAPIAVDGRFLAGPDTASGAEITLLVTAPGERPLPFLALFKPDNLTRGNVAVIPPHGEISGNIPVSAYFYFPSPGRYEVQAIYDTSGARSPLNFWRGRLVSAPAFLSAQAPQSAQAGAAAPPQSAPAPAAASPTAAALLSELARGKALYRNYRSAMAKARKAGKPDVAANWKTIAADLRNKWMASRAAAVSDAISIYNIQLPPAKPAGVEDSVPVEWGTDAAGNPWLGESAFASPGELAASLTALQTLVSHGAAAVSIRDFHLLLALAARDTLSAAGTLGLSADEISAALAFEKRNEMALDPARRSAAESGAWPQPPAISPLPAVKGAVLYTPPSLQLSDGFFIAGIFSGSRPVPGVPVLLAEPAADSFIIVDNQTTDENGHVTFDIPEGAASLLVAPAMDRGPFPQRIPVSQQPPQPGAPAVVAPPSLAGVPSYLEPGLEEFFSGSALADRAGATSLSFGDRELPVLAATPSLLLTRIPRLRPSAWRMTITTPGGAFSFDVTLAAIRADLGKIAMHRGDETPLTITEAGAPALNVWVAVDGPALVFSDGSSRTTAQLANRTPLTLSLRAAQPGKFRLTYGILKPWHQRAMQQLQSLAASLRDPRDAALADQALLALEENQFGRMESLLELLRYNARRREQVEIPVESVLQLLP